MKTSCSPFFFVFIPLVLLATIISGCGYSLHSRAVLPFKEVSIGLIENRTLEPKLQDMLHKALTLEFQKHGVSVTPHASTTLKGVVRSFDMTSVSEKDNVAVEFRVTINADFTLTGPTGKAEEIKNMSSPFIVIFDGSKDMGNLIAAKEAAAETAMKDVAVGLMGSLLFK